MHINKIERNLKRIKQTGEVFTPLSITENIINSEFTQEQLQSDIFVDIACGDGNMLEVFLNKIRKNKYDFKCLNRIVGIDIMNDNIIYCRQRLLNNITFKNEEDKQTAINILNKNIICQNTLQFDVQKFINSLLKNE